MQQYREPSDKLGRCRAETPDTIAKKYIPSAVLHHTGPIVNDNLGYVVHDVQGKAYIHVIFPKLTPIPCKVVDKFQTVEDNLDSVQIELIQGLEDGQIKEEVTDFEEYKLGECVIELPPGLPRGTPIEVTYGYNLDQTLEVTAVVPDGRTVNVTIERETLTEEEVKDAKNPCST